MSNEERALTPIQAFHREITGREAQIRERLPSHMASMAQRFTKTIITAASKNPAILECTRESILISVMTAAELGLEPGGALGEGYLVPYSQKGVKTCQFIPGYRGLISLARRSGQIVSIEAHVVRDGDEFECEFGLEPKLIHKPNTGDKLGDVRAAYAVAKIVGGGVQYEMMVKSEIDAIRNRSRAGEFGPWKTDYSEMARKTVVRRLFKYLPVSVEMARAMEVDDEDRDDLDPDLELMPETRVVDDANARAEAAAAERKQ